jgi:pyridoxal phosphate enzyme (YggS family)
VTPLQQRLQSVRDRIAGACSRARRDPAEVTLVAISKTMSAEVVREAFASGQSVFGENRVQEALGKMGALGEGPRWHLVGHLQKNKARQAVGAFELIHSVDSVELAQELDQRAAGHRIVQAVLLQANLADEASKHGAGESAVSPLIEAASAMPHLDVRGLMIIPPFEDDPESARPWFRRLRELRDRAAEQSGRPLPELSMGMTGDFEVAIEEGATIVRVGRAIFGERV